MTNPPTTATAPTTAPPEDSLPTTTSITPPAPTTSTVAAVLVSDDFPRATIGLDGESLFVAVADTVALRQRGLMGVTSLGDLDGMLFVFDEESPRSFWMKSTLIPLDIGFFDASGRLVSVTGMVPCEADPCPRYPSDGPAMWALETEAGGLAGLAADAVLAFPG